MKRCIVHADMDAFYAAVEQLDRPELRGQAVLVGSPCGRGVVTTASYEARPFGVGSAMPMSTARRRCPKAVIVPPRFHRYGEVSDQVMAAFARFSPTVEALSLDEAFLDMSGTERLFGAPDQIAARIREAVFEATGGLTVSVGVAATKYVAKVASGFRKPNGSTVVREEHTLDFLHPLPISRLWGAGPKIQQRLRDLGLQTIGDVARCRLSELEDTLGRMGSHFHRLAWGRDPRPVRPTHALKSLGSEHTLERDIRGRAAIWPHVLISLDRLGHRLRQRGCLARGLRLKLKSSDFCVFTRQMLFAHPTASGSVMAKVASTLLGEFNLELDYRLVGATAVEPIAAGHWDDQIELFVASDAGLHEKQERLDRALDDVWKRFGMQSVKRASSL